MVINDKGRKMVKSKQKAKIYFTTVAAISDDFAAFGGHMIAEKSDPTFTRLVAYSQGQWGILGDIMDVVYSLETKPGTDIYKNNLCLIGRDGFYREYVPGKKPIDSPIKKKEVGYLEGLRLIGNNLYACGSQGQVYCLKGSEWISLDNNLFLPFSGKVERCLLSIDGFSEQDIFTVGEGGAVWHCDGKNWSQLDSPTNLSINCVLCSSSGFVYLCGDNGLLFRSTKDGQWKELPSIELTQQSLFDMTEFHGDIFITAGDKLLMTDGEVVNEVKVPTDDAPHFFSIDSASNCLWCVGNETVYQFDGKMWHKHICPDNR